VRQPHLQETPLQAALRQLRLEEAPHVTGVHLLQTHDVGPPVRDLGRDDVAAVRPRQRGLGTRGEVGGVNERRRQHVVRHDAKARVPRVPSATKAVVTPHSGLGPGLGPEHEGVGLVDTTAFDDSVESVRSAFLLQT
jgi:hypothetical protein